MKLVNIGNKTELIVLVIPVVVLVIMIVFFRDIADIIVDSIKEYPEAWVTGIAGVAATAGTLISYEYQKRKDKINALFEIYKLLNDNAHRNARRRIINLHNLFIYEAKAETLIRMNALKREDCYNIFFVESNHIESMEIVKADFDYAGALVMNRVILEKEFLEVFWFDILVCWKVLEDNITKKKYETQLEDYMSNFTRLQDKADSYRERKHSSVSDYKIDPTNNKDVSIDTVAFYDCDIDNRSTEWKATKLDKEVFYLANDENVSIKLTELNGTKRTFRFSKGAYVAKYSSNIVAYNTKDLKSRQP